MQNRAPKFTPKKGSLQSREPPFCGRDTFEGALNDFLVTISTVVILSASNAVNIVSRRRPIVMRRDAAGSASLSRCLSVVILS